ncbi:hypothetical protein E2I00_011917 [Balaenoptera physalus]|uniref:Glutamate-rich protein 1 n=1 Tax=Balaenoptera physalus TaxID=9770 RepID=A0A6A1QAG5_BALPH|nr:hypothetical protein E2I00_011917 [Balaenoptera physalus]
MSVQDPHTVGWSAVEAPLTLVPHQCSGVAWRGTTERDTRKEARRALALAVSRQQRCPVSCMRIVENIGGWVDAASIPVSRTAGDPCPHLHPPWGHMGIAEPRGAEGPFQEPWGARGKSFLVPAGRDRVGSRSARTTRHLLSDVSGRSKPQNQDLHAQPKRRRIRKHNSKKKFKNPNNDDVRVSDGEDVADREGGVPEAEEEGATDAGEEDVKSTNEKADGILNFLKSTQEIYFYDGMFFPVVLLSNGIYLFGKISKCVSKDSDSAVFMETSEELFKYLETHSMPSSDVFILDHMKTLLLLQDTERLKSALEVFPEHCRMPPDYARVISAFFNYWITHILPEKNNE